MRLPKRGEKGFTLIELLIVVAILGVLAAVVIPNVGRFIGRGEEEAKDTEFATIQASVHAMMVDNGLAVLPTPVATRTNLMTAFPDNSPVGSKGTDFEGDTFAAGDGVGWVLFACDRDADGAQTGLVNYVATNQTAYWYTASADGTIVQYESATP